MAKITWCDDCHQDRPEGHTCYPKYFCQFEHHAFEIVVRAPCEASAAEKAVELYDEEGTDPGEITTTVKVDVTGPEGIKKRFVVHGEYSIEYNAYEEDTVG